jgi:hypothetical protein
VNAALFFEFDLVLVLLWQRVFHLFKADIVHFRGINVGTDQLGSELFGERDR